MGITHIEVEFLKCEWKVFCQVWENLSKDDLKLNLISQLHMGQKTVHLNMPEQTAMHSI